MAYDGKYAIILFDGVCNLCSSVVQFAIKHDPKRHFRFASLQSEFGQNVMKKFGLPIDQLNSFILLENNKIYTKSTAALMVTKKLNKGWSLLYAFMIVPSFIRNIVYDYVARHRYNWYGSKEECWIPTPELKQLFLD